MKNKEKLFEEIIKFRKARRDFERCLQKYNLYNDEINETMEACWNICNKLENQIQRKPIQGAICGGIIDLKKCQKCGKWLTKDEDVKKMMGTMMALRRVNYDICRSCKQKYKNWKKIKLKKPYIYSLI